ncbi:sodium:solute symporter [Flaviaesturariibacter amylovorans]|uniref:Sodium:solute symporter n=1 Tax=Flaviaesturariibacter amylovorans TaxID=1084520 RepID=A0ABP8H108_9BACT
MNALDWTILVLTLLGIVLYGLYKSRASRNLEGYFLSNRSMPWYLVLLSIMGTQASAITFLSGPGQAFADGMRFVQYYFGLPLAMIVICITFVPLFNRLRVFTAYEFLEERFDTRTRLFTSFLFLLQRGLSTGISIYAPTIILCALFGWDVFWTNILMGGLLIIYTVAGGARAVAHTQKLQLFIIFAGMALVGYWVVHLLPSNVGMGEALHIGGKLGRLNIITDGDTAGGFDWTDKYNIWSGVIGGFFLALSYFGTDQSQVGRYLTAQNNTESRLGLLMNGLVKIPMQFGILLIGVLIFSFYQFRGTPLTFNSALVANVEATPYRDSLRQLQDATDTLNTQRRHSAERFAAWVQQPASDSFAYYSRELKAQQQQSETHRKTFREWTKQSGAGDGNDTNYVFLAFVKENLPAGLRGLLIAVIFLAAWGSIAAALNSLAASTVVDLHKRLSGGASITRSESAADTGAQERSDYRISQGYTLAWGLFSIVVAQFAHRLGQSLIETVNILGSLFYGVILGIFLVAFYLKRVAGPATFVASLIVELFVILLFFNEQIPPLAWLPDISFLWLNAIGALGVVGLALLLQPLLGAGKRSVDTGTGHP